MLGTVACRIGLAAAMLGALTQRADAQTASNPNDPSVQPAAYYAARPGLGYAPQGGYVPASGYGSNYRMAVNPYPTPNYATPPTQPYGPGYGYRTASTQPAEVPTYSPPASPPAAPVAPIPQNGGGYAGGVYANGGGYMAGGDYGYGAGPGCQSCGGGGWGGYGDWASWGPAGYFRSPCGMSQHYPYYPAMHGYYYLIPYNYPHVPQHQAFMARMGVDPRNPYSNDVFRTLYAEYRAGERGRGQTPPPDTNPRQLPAWPR